jgi:para-aminobenzoate synthetase/4-amino-4-deoxychorismate lyase
VGPATWTPSLDAAQYAARIARIREYVAAGDTYQVNFTLRLRTADAPPPAALFTRLLAAQPTPHAMLIQTPAWAVCSATPELFFDLRDGRLVSRPMKGTARRGRTPAADAAARAALARSDKDRAENAMIVDMIRNDMGRVARPGSVRVTSAFDVEAYPTVFQMTSTVECVTSAGAADVMRAMFPCASITGAPKVRTMQIIRELEEGPRGLYTGAIGRMGPGPRATFAVAIRTAVVDAAGRGVYGAGGGIVWDSSARAEYDECLAKAAILGIDSPPAATVE